jgi:hypothetical protein
MTTGQQTATHIRSNTCCRSEGQQNALLFSDEQTCEEIYGLLLLLSSKVAIRVHDADAEHMLDNNERYHRSRPLPGIPGQNRVFLPFPGSPSEILIAITRFFLLSTNETTTEYCGQLW